MLYLQADSSALPSITLVTMANRQTYFVSGQPVYGMTTVPFTSLWHFTLHAKYYIPEHMDAY